MKIGKLILRISLVLSVVFLAAEVLAKDLILEQPLSSGVYSSEGGIIAQNNCLIEQSSDVVLLAGREIVLKSGFHAPQGTSFNAMIGDYGNLPEGLDTDGDNLADWWEVKYFSDTLSSEAGNDTDGDGVIDSVEFKLNSNPAFNDLPGTGVHYEYDALGRIIRIYRIPTR
jgi:hypothetical protein